MDTVKYQLQSVLQYHELLWSKILETDKVDHIEIARAASDVRGKLKNAMDSAENMFESNLKCLSHILALQKDKATLVEKHKQDIEDMNGRVSSLLTVIDSLQEQVESSSSLLRLKALWEKVLSARHPQQEQSQQHKHVINVDDTNTALAMLSALFINEVSHPDAESGKSLIQHLLQKVSELESLMTGDTKKFQDENDELRSKLQEKSAKLHEATYHLNNYKKKASSRQLEVQQLQEYTKSLEEKVSSLSTQHHEYRDRILQLEESVMQSKANQGELHQQYHDVVHIADQWKATCQQYEQTLTSYRLTAGKSSPPRSSPAHNSPPRSPTNYYHTSPTARATHSIPEPTPQSSPRFFDHMLRNHNHMEYETPYRRAYELYSPTSSPAASSYAKQAILPLDDSMNQPQPAFSYHEEDMIRPPERSASPKHHQTPSQASSHMHESYPQITPSPMTDHSFMSSVPATSQQMTMKATGTPINTRRYRRPSPSGYISSATKKSIERRAMYHDDREHSKPVYHQHISSTPSASSKKGHQPDEYEIVKGDVSMNSSMNRDITAAVAMINAMMPWD